MPLKPLITGITLGGSDLTDEVFKYLLATPPNSLVEAQAIVEDVLADPNRLAFAQRLTETGEFVGTTSIYDIDEKHRCAVLGHTWLAKSMWRTGINSEAKLLLLITLSSRSCSSGCNGMPTRKICAPRYD